MNTFVGNLINLYKIKVQNARYFRCLFGAYYGFINATSFSTFLTRMCTLMSADQKMIPVETSWNNKRQISW